MDGTKSLSKIKSLHPYPMLAKLTCIPGKRDVRLWLESLLDILPPLGFKGVLLILEIKSHPAKGNWTCTSFNYGDCWTS